MKKIYTIVTYLLLSQATFATEMASAPDAAVLYAEAINFSQLGDSRSAVSLCNKILDVSPYYHAARILKGRMHLVEDQVIEAAVCFRTVLLFDGDNTDAYLGLADLYYWNGDQSKAFDMLEEGLAKTPNSVDLLLRICRFFYVAGDYTEGLMAVEKVLSQDAKNSTALRLKAELQSTTSALKLKVAMH